MEKIVKFENWCHKCKYFTSDPGENDNPCNDCLNNPTNIDSQKPIFWKEGPKSASKS